MIMDYMYFVFCVAVFASIVGLCWRQYVIRINSSKFETNGKAAFPPLKTSLDGISELESRRIELQDRIDVWQRAQARRMERINAEDDPLPVSGVRYEFTPPSESRAESLRRRSSVAPPRQRFELIG